MARVGFKLLFEANLVKCRFVERPKMRQQPPKASDEPQMCGHGILRRGDPCLVRNLQAALGFPLRLLERIAADQEIAG